MLELELAELCSMLKEASFFFSKHLGGGDTCSVPGVRVKIEEPC